MTRTVGRYELHECLGRGGSGVVWRALPRGGGPEVALKEGRPDVPLDADAFLREAAATARLYHPSIGQVYDFGVHDERPFLVMERLDHPLSDRAPVTWPEARDVAVTLLDALAHAHARGVLHRDLKPANVLWSRQGYQLVDFGLADADGREGAASGTVPYMAPEQLRGQAADLGPWTDLYALGTLVWQLVSGRLPRSGAPSAVLEQAWQPLPSLDERYWIPEGLRPWLRRALAPRIEDRWACAADAAWALRGLSREDAGDRAEPQALGGAETFTVGPLPEPGGRETLRSEVAPELLRPPIPTSAPPELPPRPLPGNLGLGLVGLRQHPLAGRASEVVALWDHLRAVADSTRPEVVWVHGPSGCGRSRLLQWLGERAEELGVARVFRLGPDPLRAVATPLLRLPCAAAAERLGGWLGVDDVDRLDRWAEALEDGAPLPEAEAAGLAARLLGVVARERPVVVLIDDVDPDGAAWAVAQRVRLVAAPVLIVASSTATPPDDVRSVPLGWLEPAAIARMLVGVVGLTAEHAHTLARESGGSPRYALSRIQILARAGALRPSPAGLVVHDDAVHEGGERLDAWLESLDEDDRQVAELGACLGARLDRRTWARAARLAGLPLRSRLLQAGERAGLLVRDGSGWRLADAEVRTRLLARAAAGDRSRRWHRCCAEALDVEQVPEQVARHRLAAGERRAAIAPLTSAALAASRLQSHRHAVDLYEQVVALHEEAGEVVAAWERRGWVAWELCLGGRLEDAETLAQAVLQAGHELDEGELVASATHTLAVLKRTRGEDARAWFRQAAEAYREAGNLVYAWNCDYEVRDVGDDPDRMLAFLEQGGTPLPPHVLRTEVGRHLIELGRFDQAVEVLETTRRVAQSTPGAEPFTRVVDTYLCRALLWSGQHERALERITGTLRTEVDDLDQLTQSLKLSLAEVYLRLRDPDAAQRVLATVRPPPGSRQLWLGPQAHLAARLGHTDRYDALMAGHPPSRGTKRHRRRVLRAQFLEAAECWRERGDEVRAAQADAWVARQVES